MLSRSDEPAARNRQEKARERGPETNENKSGGVFDQAAKQVQQRDNAILPRLLLDNEVEFTPDRPMADDFVDFALEQHQLPDVASKWVQRIIPYC